MKFRGDVLSANKMTSYGRYYSKEVLNDIKNQIEGMIRNNSKMLGKIFLDDLPYDIEFDEISDKDAAMKIIDAKIIGDKLYIYCETLDNNNGLLLSEYLKAYHKNFLCISGTGDVDDYNNVSNYEFVGVGMQVNVDSEKDSNVEVL